MVGSQQQAKRPGSGDDGKKTVSLKCNTGRKEVRNVVCTRQNLIKHNNVYLDSLIFTFSRCPCLWHVIFIFPLPIFPLSETRLCKKELITPFQLQWASASQMQTKYAKNLQHAKRLNRAWYWLVLILWYQSWYRYRSQNFSIGTTLPTLNRFYLQQQIIENQCSRDLTYPTTLISYFFFFFLYSSYSFEGENNANWCVCISH